MPKPVFSSGFDVVEEGDYLLKVVSTEFSKEDKGLSCRVRNEVQEGIEHDDQDGKTILDNFPLYTSFGVARLLGLMIKTGVKLDPQKNYPDDYFNDSAIQEKTVKNLVERLYGGTVKHAKAKLTAGSDTETTMSNIRTYMTKDEYREKVKLYSEKSKKSGNVKSKENTGKETDFPPEGGTSGDDDF